MNHSNEQRGSKPKRSIPMMHIYRPNTGQQLRCEALNEIEKRYVKVSKEEAEKHWILQYDLSANTCSHVFWNGICRTVNANMECEVSLNRSEERRFICKYFNYLFAGLGWFKTALLSYSGRICAFGLGSGGTSIDLEKCQ